jgi:hypothetical protein
LRNIGKRVYFWGKYGVMTHKRKNYKMLFTGIDGTKLIFDDLKMCGLALGVSYHTLWRKMKLDRERKVNFRFSSDNGALEEVEYVPRLNRKGAGKKTKAEFKSKS